MTKKLLEHLSEILPLAIGTIFFTYAGILMLFGGFLRALPFFAFDAICLWMLMIIIKKVVDK